MARLVVLAPSIGATPKQWDPLLARLRAEPEWARDTHILHFTRKTSIMSSDRALDLANLLAATIETEWNASGGFEEIVLMGYSLGAMLIRQAYLLGLGNCTAGVPQHAWATKVSRLILFAGINRGIHLRWFERLLLTFVKPGDCLLRDLLIGSDFVTNVRIWWIKKLAALPRRPIVIQLRGTKDIRIRSDDSLDIEGFLEGHEMVVPNAAHNDLVAPDMGNEFSEEKYRILRHAVLRDLPDSPSSNRIDDPERKIFFVVHGIRASNDDWVADVAARISREIQGATVIPPFYGRFSALQFAVPLLRRKKIRFFQDLYSAEVAKNPRAHFNFVGHSYGTYLLGHSLRNLSGMTFDRVSLNGSVLPERWSWDSYRSQVSELRNARAQHDFPVAVLCSALKGLRMRDIGTAGYTGFQIPFALESEKFFYRGGHGATVAGPARNDIIDFLRDGSSCKSQTELVPEDQKFSRISAGAWAFPYLLLSLLVALSATLVHLLTKHYSGGPQSILAFVAWTVCAALVLFVPMLLIALFI